MTAVKNQLQGLETDVKKIDGRNTSQIYSFANRIKLLPDNNIDKQLLNQDVINNLGLSQYPDIKKIANAKYQNLINERLNPAIAMAIEQELKRSVQTGIYSPTYQNLKAYLMLYQPNHYDAKFISQWASNQLLTQGGSNTIKPEEIDSLKNLIATQKVISRNSYDEALVTQARNLLAGQDIAGAIYNGLLTYTQTLDNRSLPKI